MQGGEDVNIEELASNLSTYKEQLSEVKKLLAADPGNSEYVDMEKELIEVIALTEEILVTNKQAAYSRNASELEEYLSPKGFPEPEVGPSEFTGLDTHEFYKFAVGMKVQAVWSEDGEWYGATIEALTPNGYYVCYDGWGNKEEVDHCNVRPTEEGETNTLLEAERQAEVTRQAIKRKIAQAAVMEFQQRAIPTKLRIAPNDPEDVPNRVGLLDQTMHSTWLRKPDDPHGPHPHGGCTQQSTGKESGCVGHGGHGIRHRTRNIRGQPGSVLLF
ncbi:hypothetical protein HPP92_001835 [Vanilla planifolia]|uniref:Survival of motor neuron-related-splicing factor 30 n=1 Tax=Vanilla planifolia TaxID=51239 RepID=A0A835S390_VANPL|nr:hypothetical protein HPP92_001835 [Vanilla planifolia]